MRSRLGLSGGSPVSAADAFRSLVRRWYIALLGLLVTFAGCVVLAPGQHVYSARANVVFLWPGSVPVSPTDDTGIPALVNFAAMVRLALPAAQSGSDDGASFGGSLVGAGVRKGYAIALPNSGGQWSQSYSEPMLAIEAVDATPQDAENELKSIMRQIEQTTDDLQARLNVPSTARVTTSAPYANIDIVDGGVNAGTRDRGLLALGSLGGLLSLVAAVVVDTAMVRRRRPEDDSGSRERDLIGAGNRT